MANSDKHNLTELSQCVELGSLNEEDKNELKKVIKDNPEVLPPPVIKYVMELEENVI